MTVPFFHRHRIWILTCLAFAAGFVIHGSYLAARNTSNQIIDWLPAEFEETRKLLEFAEQFGSEEFVMVSWPDCTLDDPRVARMADELRQPAMIDGVEEKFFEPVLTGPEVIATLQAEPLNLRRSTVLHRLKRFLIGEDEETTCIVLTLVDPAGVNRHQAVGFIQECADRVEGLSGDTIHLAGTTVDSVAIDEASQDIGVLSLIAFTISFVLAFISFRHAGLAIMVFVIAVFNQMITLSLVHYTGWHMDSVLMLAPPLVGVLTVSASVHLVNYYGDAIGAQGLLGPPERAVQLGLVPCLLAAITTSLGLIALLASYLVPLQRFGMYAASGVLLGTGVLFLFVPASLSLSPPRRWADRKADSGDANEGSGTSWAGFLAIVSSGRYLILLAAVGLLAAGLAGARKTKGTAFLHDMFSADARIVKDYDWLETHVGPLVPVEVVLRTPTFPEEIESYETPMLDRMNWVRRIQLAMASVDNIDATVSALTFAPLFPRDRLRGFQLAERTRRITLEKTVRKRRTEFIRLGYLRETPSAIWWRISGHVPAGRRADYNRILRDLDAKIAPILANAKRDYPRASVITCGGLPLVQKAQEQMVADLIYSFTIAFGLIAAAMILLMWAVSFRDLREAGGLRRFAILAKAAVAGLLAMIPNVLPCLLVFGAMGWLEVNVEVGTVMTATAAMGIAVDDTLHFVIWFRRGLADGLSRHDATGFAYQRCGYAMVQTSLICGLGLLVFAASPFGPIARFAWLMSSMLLLALLADLVVLPALLVSRLGWFFSSAPRPVKTAEREPSLVS